MSRICKIFFSLVAICIILLNFSQVFAAVDMNLTNNSNVASSNTNSNTVSNTNTPSTSFSSVGTSSFDLQLNNILNICLIVIGVLLILLGIAILIRLK